MNNAAQKTISTYISPKNELLQVHPNTQLAKHERFMVYGNQCIRREMIILSKTLKLPRWMSQ